MIIKEEALIQNLLKITNNHNNKNILNNHVVHPNLQNLNQDQNQRLNLFQELSQDQDQELYLLLMVNKIILMLINCFYLEFLWNMKILKKLIRKSKNKLIVFLLYQNGKNLSRWII